MNKAIYTLLLAAMPWVAAAQSDLHLKIDWDKIAPKAEERVEVNLDGNLLQLAARFLSSDDPEESRVKKMVSRLKGVYVRSYEFAKEGEYSEAEVEALRSQLKGWQRIVDVRSRKKGENTGVYLKGTEKDVEGVVIIAAEAKELTIVNIVGPIDIDSLSELGGHFGIPKVDKKSMKDKAGKD